MLSFTNGKTGYKTSYFKKYYDYKEAIEANKNAPVYFGTRQGKRSRKIGVQLVGLKKYYDAINRVIMPKSTGRCQAILLELLITSNNMYNFGFI